jgi:hypothetical protein
MWRVAAFATAAAAAAGVVAAGVVAADNLAADDLAALTSQLTALLLPNASDPYAASAMRVVDGEVPSLVATLNASGLWPDVTYTDSADASEWAAAVHLQRSLMLATASATNASAFCGNATVVAAARASVAGWIALNPQNVKCVRG